MSGHACMTCGSNYLMPHKPCVMSGGAGEQASAEGRGKDHTCRSGMVCSSWGSPQWYCMHMTSMDYPEEPSDEDKFRYKQWLENKQFTLPCCCCRSHFVKHMSIIDLESNSHYFDNTASFFRLVFDIHNTVNKSLDKPILDEKDYIKLFHFYSASRGVTDDVYGRAFVVVQPVQKTSSCNQSILIDRGLVQKGCALASATDPDHACVTEGRIECEE
jgi:hypothetical protein